MIVPEVCNIFTCKDDTVKAGRMNGGDVTPSQRECYGARTVAALATQSVLGATAQELPCGLTIIENARKALLQIGNVKDQGVRQDAS